ncbi:programmed cell death 1 ligand 1-like [Sardina pilchardus]|uniref:programmed cell death 1 ligand 1-like n=1 Tax=Sardina pilchardus TaxID=27697 RepID=UPI002E163823
MKDTLVLYLVLASLQFCASDVNNTFDAALHDSVILVWKFRFNLDPERNLVVHIQKSEESSVDIIHSDQKGLKVFPNFIGRVELLQNSFPDNVVALKMDNVSIPDTGAYKCFASMSRKRSDPLYIDQRLCHLKVQAPWSPVHKSNVSIGSGVHTLRCEAEGYPLGHVTWTDGHGKKLTAQAKLITSITSEQLIHIDSQLNVTISTSSNYTCTVMDDRGVSQAATFVFPEEDKSRPGYVLTLAVLGGVVMVMVVGLLCLQLRARRARRASRTCIQR